MQTLRDGTIVSLVNIDKEIHKKFSTYCKTNGFHQWRLLSKIVDNWIKENGN